VVDVARRAQGPIISTALHSLELRSDINNEFAGLDIAGLEFAGFEFDGLENDRPHCRTVM